MQDIKRGMNAHDRKGDSEGTYFHFFYCCLQSVELNWTFYPAKERKHLSNAHLELGEMKSSGIIPLSAH